MELEGKIPPLESVAYLMPLRLDIRCTALLFELHCANNDKALLHDLQACCLMAKCPTTSSAMC